MIGTEPGWWHDFAWCCLRFYDRRGQQVAVITDEAWCRAGISPRALVELS